MGKAESMPLAKTAYDARLAVQKSFVKDLDRPTPFTLRGVRYENKGNGAIRFSRVFITEPQHNYLKTLQYGGVQKGKAPVSLGLNKYGNITRGKIRRLLDNRRKYFLGAPRGRPYGLYERTPKKLVLRVVFPKAMRYKPNTINFWFTVQRSIEKTPPSWYFWEALTRAGFK